MRNERLIDFLALLALALAAGGVYVAFGLAAMLMFVCGWLLAFASVFAVAKWGVP